MISHKIGVIGVMRYHDLVSMLIKTKNTSSEVKQTTCLLCVV